LQHLVQSPSERRAPLRFAVVSPTGSPRVVKIEFPAARRPGALAGPRRYRRGAGDGEHVEIVFAERVYRVRRAELRPG